MHFLLFYHKRALLDIDISKRIINLFSPILLYYIWQAQYQMLNPNCVIGKDLLMLCEMLNINSTIGGECIGTNRRNSLPRTVRTSRKRLCNQWVGYLLWLGSMIYEMDFWTSTRCQVWSLIVVRMAIELKYHNTSYIHTNIYMLLEQLTLKMSLN